jgi:hypothetical protein
MKFVLLPIYIYKVECLSVRVGSVRERVARRDVFTALLGNNRQPIRILGRVFLVVRSQAARC